MSFGFLDVAVTPAVRATQQGLGVAHLWKDYRGDRAFDRFTDREANFIAKRDTFYLATVGETGWPYVQHRGGPAGFLKVADERTLVFADYGGNRQYITVGNLSANDKACLILMDYPNRARLKIYAHAEAVALDADSMLTERVLDEAGGTPERLIRLKLRTFDWNCPRHIVPRFSESEMADALRPLLQRLESLKTENASLRAQSAAAAAEE